MVAIQNARNLSNPAASREIVRRACPSSNPLQFQMEGNNYDALGTNEMKSARALSGFTSPSPTVPRRESYLSMHFVTNKSRITNNGTIVKSTRR